ncbi:hypothetical protein U5817_09815 [Aromatoleum evansii]|uniref:Uncharacterized protein n=1 Tax=Aromatoleum evansii TaxID=59406 RepID=A0ABZ1AQW4_AROEV|nr:hypothetical protein U5817_09465 [Aromatoleum evansii]WRL48322.1 hypothetical protein U5817_09815 [Aromatoleum evansii]
MTTTVEQALEASHTLMTVREIMRDTGHAEPVVRAELRRLAGVGQIEHIPGRGRYDGRYGLLRPIAKDVPDEADSEGGEADVQASVPEQAKSDEVGTMRDAKADLAEIRQRLSPFVVERDPETMTEVELAEHAAAVIRDGMERIFSRDSGDTVKAGDELANAHALSDKLEHLLGVERQTSAALREQLEHITTGGEPTAKGLCASQIDSYAVIAPKRPIRRFTGHDSAVKSAMAAASNGSKRGEVFALVHVGSAKRGAVWRPAK